MVIFFAATLFLFVATIPQKNIETNDIFYRKVALLMYTEMVNFRPQSLKAASKVKPHRGLGTRLPLLIMVTLLTRPKTFAIFNEFSCRNTV